MLANSHVYPKIRGISYFFFPFDFYYFDAILSLLIHCDG